MVRHALTVASSPDEKGDPSGMDLLGVRLHRRILQILLTSDEPLTRSQLQNQITDEHGGFVAYSTLQRAIEALRKGGLVHTNDVEVRRGTRLLHWADQEAVDAALKTGRIELFGTKAQKE